MLKLYKFLMLASDKNKMILSRYVVNFRHHPWTWFMEIFHTPKWEILFSGIKTHICENNSNIIIVGGWERELLCCSTGGDCLRKGYYDSVVLTRRVYELLRIEKSFLSPNMSRTTGKAFLILLINRINTIDAVATATYGCGSLSLIGTFFCWFFMRKFSLCEELN